MSAEAASRPSHLSRGLATARAVATVSVVGWALVALGVLVRVVRFLAERSLWDDEARLALNITGRSFGGLLERLDFVQAAPFGFLFAEKAAVELVGDGEHALRLVPLAAGLASLFLFVGVARRALDGLAVPLAIGMFAIAEPLVYYSSEVKQYSLDVLATVLVLYLSFRAAASARPRARELVALGAAGAVAIWFSHPVAFVLAGIGAAIAFADPGWSVDRRARHAIAFGLGATWLVTFSAAYLVVRENVGDIRSALELGDSARLDLLDVAEAGWDSFAYPAGFARTSIALAVLVAAVGAVALYRSRRFHATVFAGTLAATLGAVLAQRYPFGDRFSMFLVPIVLLVVAQGIESLRVRTADRLPLAWIAVAVALLLYPAGVAASRAVDPPPHEETKPVLAHLAAAWQSGDSLYVSQVAQFPLRYYTECRSCDALGPRANGDLEQLVLSARTDGQSALRSSPRLVVGEIGPLEPPATYVSDFGRLQARSRVWILLSSGWDDRLATSLLDCLGRRLDGVTDFRAAAYLYDLSGGAARRAACLPKG